LLCKAQAFPLPLVQKKAGQEMLPTGFGIFKAVNYFFFLRMKKKAAAPTTTIPPIMA
jgi:hypothetical protein